MIGFYSISYRIDCCPQISLLLDVIPMWLQSLGILLCFVSSFLRARDYKWCTWKFPALNVVVGYFLYCLQISVLEV